MSRKRNIGLLLTICLLLTACVFILPASAKKTTEPAPLLNHADKISSYEGPATCLQCHSITSYKTNLLEDVLKSTHYQFRTENNFIMIPGGGSHGMLDRACGLPGTNLMADNYAGIATAIDGTTKVDGCGKCHIAYKAPYKYNVPTDAKDDLDCLVCHAEIYGFEWDDPALIEQYGLNSEPHARTVVSMADGTLTWSQDRSLKTAQSVGNPIASKNCLRCHGKNFEGHKRATPFDAESDVHAAKNVTCLQCHPAKNHQIARGNFVTDSFANEQDTQEVSCNRCHGTSPHTLNNAVDLNKHVANVSCEVCHIPSMDVADNVSVRAWAPYTFDPRTQQWSTTKPVANESFWDAYTEFYPEGKQPAIRWFDGTASMLAQPFGSYDTRMSTGGCSKLFAFKPFINGILFDAGWLPGPNPETFDMVNDTWPYSMKEYYEKNWIKFLEQGFVDSQYPTAQDYWNDFPKMAETMNQFPMMLFMDRTTYMAEAGIVNGSPVPGPQDATTYPGIAKAINIGMGRIGIDMGYFPADSDAEAVGGYLWSGSFFGMWVPINNDINSPFYGELSSFITMSHGIKGAAEAVTCYECHYTETEYTAGEAMNKRLDFGVLGWPNIDTNPIVDPLYDTNEEASVPAVDRITFNYTVSRNSEALKITVYAVDSVTRAPMSNVIVNGTLTGPDGQKGLPADYSGLTGADGSVSFSFNQRTLLPGTYTFNVNSLTYDGVITNSDVFCSYLKE